MTSTTTLIAELLISGVMALVWVVLGFLALLGVDWLHPALLQGWQVPLGAVAIALAYTMAHPALVRPHGRRWSVLSIGLAGGSLTLLALAFYTMHQRGPELVKLAKQGLPLLGGSASHEP